MEEEKAILEKRLRNLRLKTAATSDAPAKRPYPPVLPKYIRFDIRRPGPVAGSNRAGW
jgi:hypothetical protein